MLVVVGVKFNKTFWDFIFIRRVKKETVKRIERWKEAESQKESVEAVERGIC